MAKYIFTCKEDASDENVADLKQKIKNQGGTIVEEYTIIKGFVVSLPDDAVNTFDSHPSVESVEPDGEIKTQ